MTDEDQPAKDSAAREASDSGERSVGGNTGLKLVSLRSDPSELDLDNTSLEEAEPESRRLPPASNTAPDPYIGCTFDNRYRVESILGEGGMGVVYQCSHKIIGKKVAMKILRSDLARDSELTERFLIEARAASSIGSEHIIDISDFGQLPDGSAYFVMEFLEGQPLAALVEDHEPLPVPRILNIAAQMTAGLAEAHTRQIVHRDLKPDNIFLIRKGNEPEFVKILDFGIAKVSTSATGKLTRAGSVFGTPHYMSPEQAAGAAVDHRGDIYALGVILYELSTGNVPFDADNFMGILTQHMYKAPIPPRQLEKPPADMPAGLEAIILKCLSKRAEQRFQSMEELGEDIGRMQRGDVPLAVEEMLRRSGSFQVPDDYFASPVPAADVGPGSSVAGLVAARAPGLPMLAGGAAVVLLVAGFLLLGGADEAQPTTEAVPSAAAVPASVEAPAPPPVVSRQVVVGVAPMAAHVFVGDEDLGTSPVVVDVKEGATVLLEVRHEGYKPQRMKLDGSEPKMSVHLSKLEPAKPVAKVVRRVHRPAPARKKKKKKKKTAIGGGEIVNPWAN